MEEINLEELFKYFKTKIHIIVIFVAFAVTVGSIYHMFFQTPLYKSYTTILLTKDESENLLTITDLNINQNLVGTYSELIKSKKIAKEVIANLSLNIGAEELIKNTNVESVNDTEMIKVTIVNKDAELAKRIADEIAQVFDKEVVNYYDISNIGIVDYAEVALKPYNINLPKQIVLSAMVGLVVSFGLVFVIYYFDKTIKTKEEIENKLGISVIGTIPYIGGTK